MSTLQSAQILFCFIFIFFPLKILCLFGSSPTKLHRSVLFVSLFEFLQDGFLQKIHESVLSHTIFILMQQNQAVTKCSSAFSAVVLCLKWRTTPLSPFICCKDAKHPEVQGKDLKPEGQFLLSSEMVPMHVNVCVHVCTCMCILWEMNLEEKLTMGLYGLRSALHRKAAYAQFVVSHRCMFVRFPMLPVEQSHDFGQFLVSEDYILLEHSKY